MRKFFAPEVVQTSNMDCGPAALKCLAEGFGKRVSYGRLREACQTGIDGTSIDTMETVANQLGLEAEQILIPADHLLLPESKALPALVVVKLPNGLTHFVVVWRRHGNLLQIMDPAVGRRWTTEARFRNEIYSHSMAAGASDWRDYAATEEFERALRHRLHKLGISGSCLESLIEGQAPATLDAGARLMESLVKARGVRGSRSCARLLERLCTRPELIPPGYWFARPVPGNAEAGEQVLMSGAVLVRVRGTRTSVTDQALGTELSAAVREPSLRPGRELMRLLWRSGISSPGILLLALGVAAGGVLVEALLFRGLFDITGELGLAGQRMAAMAAILLFSLALLLMEAPIFSGVLRLGRQIENRLRVAFLEKIPKLGDRYFQSRLTSDMAERSHATHRLRNLPTMIRRLTQTIFELCATAGGIIWLEPSAAPLVLVTAAAALLPAFTTQALLAERDLRVRTHAGGMTRFYLDAMLGLLAIRAHGAERSVRREHEKLLGEWGNAALRLQRAAVSVEAVQLVAMFGLIAWLLLSHPLAGAEMGRVLLVVYWALNLPVLGQDVGALARQYPYYRNLTLRLLEPLGAPEETASESAAQDARVDAPAPGIDIRGVSVEVSGHTILRDINVKIEPGSHVAVVGPSGAGKSSLVGLLLGWWKPSRGEISVNGAPLDCEQLRVSTAWVDPAVQLWNRSLFANLSYGSETEAVAVGRAVDGSLLRNVLESLPEGLQTKLGEGGALVSGGEGQRVRLGRAMLRARTRLAILDEPFRGLDREKRQELLSRARQFWRGSTMLCITHDLEETQAFDRVLVIEQGRIVEDGTPADLRGLPNSRYGQLIEAEAQTRSRLWAANIWRRIRIHSGRMVEQVPKPVEENRREAEVA
jgi:ATP-binding cassette subfamily B protein